MHALKKWQVYLEGRHFAVYTDHATLHHFPEQPDLTRWQARWMEKMQEYVFDLKVILLHFFHPSGLPSGKVRLFWKMVQYGMVSVHSEVSSFQVGSPFLEGMHDGQGF